MTARVVLGSAPKRLGTAIAEEGESLVVVDAECALLGDEGLERPPGR